MGYDLHGKAAKSSRGEYFRNNIWWWRRLAEFVVERCDVATPEGWFDNGGHEVSAVEAKRIAERLEELIRSGEVADFARSYEDHLANLPVEQCGICHGAGVRNDEVLRGTCNTCRGKGTVDSFARNYPFSEENVREFAEFCEHSGGFTID